MNILKRLHSLDERRNQSLIILPALSLLLGALVVSGGRSASHARDAFVRTGPGTAAASDCLTYNPHSLRIVNEGSRGWLLTDGVSRMHMLDNRGDAERALALTRRHMGHCFIGRDNHRPNRMDYIVEYWSGGAGIPTVISGEDCISYDPRSLRIVNEGANGWLLTDGRSRMLMLDNREDAAQAWRLARGHSRQCFIGRDNNRPNRKDYILSYWR